VYQDLPSGTVQPGRPLTWEPQWRSLSAGSGTVVDGMPTGRLQQPFHLYRFCMAAEGTGDRKVAVETTSRARGSADTMLYVAREPADAAVKAATGEPLHMENVGFGRNIWRCVRHNSWPAPRTQGDSCAKGTKAVQLSRLVFGLEASGAHHRGFNPEGQVCYRAYVLLRSKQRMIADMGLTVTVT
jgi:hypothetical protein